MCEIPDFKEPEWQKTKKKKPLEHSNRTNGNVTTTKTALTINNERVSRTVDFYGPRVVRLGTVPPRRWALDALRKSDSRSRGNLERIGADTTHRRRRRRLSRLVECQRIDVAAVGARTKNRHARHTTTGRLRTAVKWFAVFAGRHTAVDATGQLLPLRLVHRGRSDASGPRDRLDVGSAQRSWRYLCARALTGHHRASFNSNADCWPAASSVDSWLIVLHNLLWYHK